MSGAAAVGFAIIMAGLALFQAALAAGAPIGHFAWGGQYRRLPTALRVGSLVSILIYAGFAAVLLQHAGIVALFSAGDWLGIAVWAVVCYSALGIVVNGISRSLPERFTMTPLVAILFGLSLVVALRL